MFKYSTFSERFLMITGVIFAFIMGTSFSLITVVYGEFMTLLIARNTEGTVISPSHFLHWFGGGETNTGAPYNEQMDSLLNDALAYMIGVIILSTIHFICGAISITCLNYSSLNKVGRIRRMYLEAVLKQDVAWHDVENTGTFATRLTDSLDKLQDGTGEKVGIFVYLVSTFIISIIVGLFYGWELTLVMTSIAPVFIIITVIVARLQSKLADQETYSYGLAGAVVEEVLSSIRTVMAYRGEKKEVERYNKKLELTKRIGIKSGIYVGIGGGLTWLLIFSCYALCFFYGSPLIIRDRDKEKKDYTPGILLIVLFGIVVGAMNLGYTTPYLESFAKAKGAAKSVFSILNKQPTIDVNAGGIKLPDKLREVQFSDVRFTYPGRPDVEVLKGLSFKVQAGENVALVGGSGSGKSTTIQLIERFYDPTEGEVFMNGLDLKTLDLKWVRKQIGLVGQEPVLFAATIGENICCDLNVSKGEMEEAARIANAHDFIMKLPLGYNTMVGERGAQFSGGQKQRIAIARALVRNPSILLLDEATSALDVKSEAIVQDALEKASKGRTTIIISHRLSSIRNCDRIVVMSEGKFAEEGTHKDLMKAKGHYYNLVSISTEKEEEQPILLKNMFKQMKTPDADEDEENKEDKGVLKQTEIVLETLKEEPLKKKEEKASVRRIVALNRPEWIYIVLGAIGSFSMGIFSPVSAIFFGELYGALSLPDPKDVISTTNTFAIYFILLGVGAMIAVFVQFSTLTVAGVRLTSRLRKQVFGAMLKQEMAYFDNPRHGVGALCAKLSGDTSTIQGATGSKVGSLLQGFSTLGVGAFISVFYSWKMTLVCLAFVPFILISLVIEARVMQKAGENEREALEEATKVAVEAITSIRTVLSLGLEEVMLTRYIEKLKDAEIALRMKLRFRGLVYPFGPTAFTYAYGVCVAYGGYLVARENLPYKYIAIVSEALLFGAWMLGSILSFAPGLNLARLAAARLFIILDREPKIVSPPYDPDPDWKVEGEIKYLDVNFFYPTRPEQITLQNFSLDISRGQTVALVGPSGCGKSTCVQLLQRLYDPVAGTITVNRRGTTTVPLDKLRGGMGIVAQEPTLFDRTIAENIAYGDNSRDYIPMTEIITAAQNANIHSFIITLPNGYETRLGSKGTQLSGGQKQRIAIARALVRNPRILILDEATSALDTQSQKIVQEALNKAMADRTCIMIAHRLSTITHANIICVLQQGKLVEMGSHGQLLKLGGIYAQLIKQQPFS